MRVATAHSYDTTIAQITKRQAEMAAQQERISSGKRVMRASDDPVAAALSEAVQTRLSRVQTDQRALESSRTSIQQAESALGEAGDLVQRVRELIIAGGNAGYGSTEREALAKEIEGLREQLFSAVNRQNSAGQGLFGGLGGSPTPFVQEFGSGSNEVRFDGQRGQEAAGDNQLPNAMDGESIWMRVPAGNGTFSIDLAAGNTGGVRSDTGQVSNPSALTGHDYRIDFSGSAGAMQYSVVDVTTGTPVPGQTGMPYGAGSLIEFDGMSFRLSGEPRAGDQVDITPSTAPTDMFRVMQDAIDTLRLDNGSSGDAALRTHNLGRALAELDAGHERMLMARAQAGEWLSRADSMGDLLGDREADHTIENSQLVDVDLVKAYSEFKTMEVGAQAALQSYASIQKLSLFQYLS
jgi:flagellar hook-associated protein 3 FlgL